LRVADELSDQCGVAGRQRRVVVVVRDQCDPVTVETHGVQDARIDQVRGVDADRVDGIDVAPETDQSRLQCSGIRRGLQVVGYDDRDGPGGHALIRENLVDGRGDTVDKIRPGS